SFRPRITRISHAEKLPVIAMEKSLNRRAAGQAVSQQPRGFGTLFASAIRFDRMRRREHAPRRRCLVRSGQRYALSDSRQLLARTDACERDSAGLAQGVAAACSHPPAKYW